MACFKDCVLPFSELFVQGKKLAAAVLRRISDSPPWHIERYSVMTLVKRLALCRRASLASESRPLGG